MNNNKKNNFESTIARSINRIKFNVLKQNAEREIQIEDRCVQKQYAATNVKDRNAAERVKQKNLKNNQKMNKCATAKVQHG